MRDNELLKRYDPEIYEAVAKETARQRNKIELIASENFVSEVVMEANGTTLTNKYAEGYPAKRYYGGCENVDIVESLAIERAKELFGAGYANVQPHSGAQANMAVFFALLELGDTVLSMNLAHGGHLSHGSPVNMSGKYWNIVPYGVTEKDGTIVMEFKNISAYPLDFDAEEITHRFVRGDKSRTAEGNGLGLAIAKSYTEICNGTFEIVVDGDMFKAILKFRKYS